MSVWETLLLALHLVVAAGICGFVLLQHGKGADMGAAFGSGSAGSVFGAAGSANFLSRTTAWLAAVFFVTSVTLTWFGAQHEHVPGSGLMDRLPATAPATTAPATKSDVPAAPAKAGDATGAPAAPGAAPAAGAAPSKAGEVPK
jgi:preprotein translocase subunit SecG